MHTTVYYKPLVVKLWLRVPTKRRGLRLVAKMTGYPALEWPVDKPPTKLAVAEHAVRYLHHLDYRPDSVVLTQHEQYWFAVPFTEPTGELEKIQPLLIVSQTEDKK